MTTLYEEQEAAMVDYSGRVVTTAWPLMMYIKSLVFDPLSPLTTDRGSAIKIVQKKICSKCHF
jgi:hypothetical protein